MGIYMSMSEQASRSSCLHNSTAAQIFLGLRFDERGTDAVTAFGSETLAKRGTRIGLRKKRLC
jgi:hypothetical protein